VAGAAEAADASALPAEGPDGASDPTLLRAPLSVCPQTRKNRARMEIKAALNLKAIKPPCLQKTVCVSTTHFFSGKAKNYD